jgi:hypothetical protein
MARVKVLPWNPQVQVSNIAVQQGSSVRIEVLMPHFDRHLQLAGGCATSLASDGSWTPHIAAHV